MPLTDTQIKNIKPEAKQRKYADEKGLVTIQPPVATAHLHLETQ